jgi:hypothetical protein
MFMSRPVHARPLFDFSLYIAWPALALRLPHLRKKPQMPQLTRDEIEDIFHDDLTLCPLAARKAERAKANAMTA